MKLINGVKHYLVHCYELNTNEKIKVYWNKNDFALAEHLAVMGGFCIIKNLGYFYHFENLKKTMKRLGAKAIKSFYK